MLKTCCLNLDISIVNLSNSTSTVSFSSFFCCYCEFLLKISYYSFSFMFCHLNQDTASVLSIPSNCPLISTHFSQHPYMQTMFSVSHVYNSIISCKLAVFTIFFYLCIVSTMYWRLSCCLQTHVSLSESLGRVTQNGLHRQKLVWLVLMSGFSTSNFW